MIGLDGVSAQALSDTIGAVYDCALDPQLRLATCRRIARLRESACCTTRRRRSLRWLIKSCCVLLRIRVGDGSKLRLWRGSCIAPAVTASTPPPRLVVVANVRVVER